jgi:hypothetical protein
MAKITSTVASPTLPKATATPSLTRPEPRPLPGKPTLDKLLTPKRSEKLANTQANQLETIQKGVKSGAVTEKEASKLLAQQAKVAEAASKAAADGVITATEAATIQRLQARAGLDVFLAGHNGSHASPRDPALAKKQASQIDRIAQGVRSGSLTGAEANTLLTDQADIAHTAAEAQSDGDVDFIEQQMLNIRQDAASFEIQKEKRDTEKAPHAKRPSFPVVLY